MSKVALCYHGVAAEPNEAWSQNSRRGVAVGSYGCNVMELARRDAGQVLCHDWSWSPGVIQAVPQRAVRGKPGNVSPVEEVNAPWGIQTPACHVQSSAPNAEASH